jgi:uncharacterized protein
MFGPEMPEPVIDVDTEGFWSACNEGRLVVQRCTKCGEFRFPPAPICWACHSFDFAWVESEGIGEVYTWTEVHRSVHPAVAGVVPYVVVVVRLSDCGGAMVTSNLVGIRGEDVKPGMKVRVIWETVRDGVTVPRFSSV